jgi:hypothetical protein
MLTTKNTHSEENDIIWFLFKAPPPTNLCKPNSRILIFLQKSYIKILEIKNHMSCKIVVPLIWIKNISMSSLLN